MEIISAIIRPAKKGTSYGKCRKWRLFVNTREAGVKNRRFTGTYSEGKKALKSFEQELADIIPNDDTFGAYAEHRMNTRVKLGELSPNTAAKEKRHLNAVKRSCISDMRMDAIRPVDCRRALEWIRDNPQRPEQTKNGYLSNTSMQGIYAFVRETFQQAVDDELLSRNPMAKIKDPKKDTEEVEALDWADVIRLLDWLDELPLNAYVMAMYLIACLALRRAEACAVLDDEMNATEMLVTQAVKERTGQVGPPKSKAGVRKLPVMPRLSLKVAQWREHKAKKGLADAPTLACNVQGGVLRPQNLYKWWVKVTAGTEWEGVGLHQLRHSNLSHVSREMSAFDLMRYAGWSSLEPTRVYIHDDYPMMAKAVFAAWGIEAETYLRLAA